MTAQDAGQQPGDGERWEWAGLGWDEVDMATGTIRLSEHPSSGRARAIKTDAGEREIRLTAAQKQMLFDHRQEQMRTWAEKGAPPPALVVLRRDGTPMLRPWWWWRWNAIRTAAGLPRMHFYDLRHIAAYLKGKAKVHPRVAAELMGHSDPGFTMRRYMTVDDEQLLEAAEAVERLLDNGRE